MTSDEQEIRQLVSTWMAATKAGDIEKVLSLMTDDVVFLIAGQPAMRKSEFAAASRSQSAADGPEINGTSDIQEVQICGDWAFMRAQLKVVVTPKNGGAAITRAGPTLTILKKQNGKWLLARDANMLMVV